MTLVVAAALGAAVFGLLVWALSRLWHSVREVDSLLAWLRCWWRGWHDPKKVLPDGQRCRDCGLPGADMEDMGFVGGGYVPPVRRVFDRDERSFSRTSAWERGPNGW